MMQAFTFIPDEAPHRIVGVQGLQNFYAGLANLDQAGLHADLRHYRNLRRRGIENRLEELQGGADVFHGNGNMVDVVNGADLIMFFRHVIVLMLSGLRYVREKPPFMVRQAHHDRIKNTARLS